MATLQSAAKTRRRLTPIATLDQRSGVVLPTGYSFSSWPWIAVLPRTVLDEIRSATGSFWHRHARRGNPWKTPGEYRLEPLLILLIVLALCPESLAQYASFTDFRSDRREVGVKSPPQTQEDDEAREKEARNKKKESRGAIVIAPIPVSSPAIGSGIILAGGYIFPLQRADTISPPSLVGGAFLATNNGSRGAVLLGDFFLKQNTYHITTVYLKGNLNYDFYGVGTSAGNLGLKLPIKQSGQVFFVEALYRFWRDFFAGPRLLTGESTLTLRRSNPDTIPPPADTGIQTSLTGLGFRINRDTRPNRFYPTTGTLFDFSSIFFAEGLGSKYSFQSYKFTFNYYKSLNSKQVLAYNLYTCATSGSPPFYGECVYGTNNELRGYVAFQYVDRYMIATQLEYRLSLPWRFGAVAFGGLGEVAPSVGEFRYRDILPAYGGGLRFKLSKKYNVNLRADIGQGTEGHTFSMGIGEAF